MVTGATGDAPSAYTPEGQNLYPRDDLLKPLQATAHRCFWRWTDPFLIYRSNKFSSEELADASRRYADKIQSWR
jgi:putative NADPH-quinone reductase